MCISPNRLSDGTDVACHECWQCRDQRINDWVGRCIAESKTAKACHAVTLTYGRSRLGDVDHERAVILTYSDVQKYLKLLRRHGYPVRYFVTGELGSLKGRAHWHVILFWQDGFPPVELDKRFMEDHWPHGWSHWTLGTNAKNIRYNCKYVQKDLGDAERQGHLAMSKKPPLGAAYFAQMAERYVKAELAPQDLFYTFPEVRRGKPGAQSLVQFQLRDRSAELFLEHYVNAWSRAYPGRDMPRSELVETWCEWGVVRMPNALDDGVTRVREWEERRVAGRPFAGFGAKRDEKPKVGRDTYSWMSSRTIVWSKVAGCWEAPGPPGSAERWQWRRDRQGDFRWFKRKEEGNGEKEG